MVDDSDLDDLRPRKYQEEVFIAAQKENIIAALDTGSGKTYISMLLIKWIATQEGSRGKVIIFVVPKVALVEQQAAFISAHSALRVVKLYGNNIDISDIFGWTSMFENNDVFVMTAQIFLNFLNHSVLSFDKVSLIVIDECHHTRKNHPFAVIMREYLHVPLAKRPKVFGMTASPIWNPKNPTESLALLEANLAARVMGVREHIDELDIHTPKPVEIIRLFMPPLERYPTFPQPTLYDCMRIFSSAVLVGQDISWAEIYRRYDVTLYNLGPYGASLYLYGELKSRIKAAIEMASRDIQLDSRDEEGAEPRESDLVHISDIISEYDACFSEIPSLEETGSLLEWCSPKVRTLVDILLAHLSFSAFQGIIFVEQRQIAICLAQMLPNIPELGGQIRAVELLGGAGSNDHLVAAHAAKHGDAIRMFREKTINLLIATSVAEEGLDFPACDIVIRFDPLQHMVGYLQSRGRARNKTSNFVVMVQENDTITLAKYREFLTVEPELKTMYRSRILGDIQPLDDDDDTVHPDDINARERYVIPSTGAFISYDNALNLLNRLCSTIPRDRYTGNHIPRYFGQSEATLHLPACLPLSSADLVYNGPLKHSKKEAKRAVAFMAVKRLRELAVFDDFLLPSYSRKRTRVDGDGQAIQDTRHIENIMTNISVRDPWFIGWKLWIHILEVDGRLIGGLITGTQLPTVQFVAKDCSVETRPAQLMLFDHKEEPMQRRTIEAFTRLGIYYRVSAKDLNDPLSLYLVPLNADGQVDYMAMDRILSQVPHGVRDWNGVEQADMDRILVVHLNQIGRPLLLQAIRQDLSPQSCPPPGSREYGHETYADFFRQRWTRKTRRAVVPDTGPLLYVTPLNRSFSSQYSLREDQNLPSLFTQINEHASYFVPQGGCGWVDFSSNIRQAFELLPILCRRITDAYRAKEAIFRLGLPPIREDLMIQALTIPLTHGDFNNQRLETLGDAVLKTCTTVHFFNKYPYRHEGQLDSLRITSLSNRYLLSRALEHGLEQFISSEVQNVRQWRYTMSLEQCFPSKLSSGRYVQREFPRRSMQDCMEAIVGASFVTGGITMALRAGTALGLTFGGTIPWPLRYDRTQSSLKSSNFRDLELSMGYEFRNQELILEATTHPSFADLTPNPSYQRLEFLGDAVLDLVVVNYLYQKFPDATSDQLSRPRARAVCAPALASLAVRKLSLHKVMLVNNEELGTAIKRHVPQLEILSGRDVVQNGWKYQPPKAMSDVFESLIGALLLDTGYNYEKTACVVEHIMDDVLEALSPAVQKDPITLVFEFSQSQACREGVKFFTEPGRNGREGVTVRLHGVVITGPIVSSSLVVAKNLAAERALSILKDPESDKSLDRLCCCTEMDVTNALMPNVEEEDPDEEELAGILLENGDFL